MLLTALALSMSLSVGMQKAQADVTVGNWSDLRNAIQNATGIITLDDAINPGLNGNRGSVEVGASNLTIDGQNKELTGTILGLNPAQHIILNSGRTLNITNLTQSQYERFLYNNNGTVNISSESSFSNNDASAITGGEERAGAAIYNAGGIINILDSSFSGNQAYNGGAIANAGGTVVIENTDFTANSATGGNGGAIDTWGGTTTIIDSSFTNNHANDNFDYDAYARGDDSDSAQAGGAINNNNGGTLNIVAQKKDVEFTNNYVGSIQEGQWPWDPDVDNRFFNAITNNGTINLNASKGHSIIFNDSIGYVRGSSRDDNIININNSDVSLTNSAGKAITTPTAGTIAINNAVYDQTVNLYGGTLKFGTSGGFDSTEGHHVNFNIHGGLLDTIHGAAGYTGVGYVHGYSDVNFALDADADLHFADHYDVYGNYVAEDGVSLNISKISIINSSDNNKFVGEAVDVDNGNSTWEWVNVKDDTELVDADGNKIGGNTLVSWNKETGILKAGKYNLNNAVSDNETVSISDGGNYNRENVAVDLNSDRIYRLVKDEIVTQTLGDMTNGSLTIAGNGNNITALTGGISGITTGAGDTLTINDVANMSGFDTALNVTGGTVSLDNSDITNNDIGLTVSGGSATLTDSDIVGNDTGLTVTSGNVTINASAGDSAESLNTVAIDNAVGENVNNIENSGTINFNAFANAVIEVGDNVIRAVGNTVNGILSINTAENASGTVNLADVSNQTVNINKGTVTTGNVSGSDVNVTTGNIDIAAVDNSTVDVTDGTADFGTVSNNSTVTIAGGTANFNDNITSSTLTLNGGTNTIADNKTVSSSTITVANGATANIAADLNDSDITTAGNTTISGDVTGEYNGYAYTTQITNSGTADISGNVSGASIASIGNGNTNLTGTKVENSMIFASSTVNLGTADGNISLAGSIINGSNTNLIASTVTGGADGAFTINDGSTLSSAADSTIAASILGSGNINNTGGELNFATTGGASGANFNGTINATAGTINLGSNYGLNTGANINLAGGTLNYATGSGSLSDNGLFGLALNGNGTANINGSGRETANITLTDKFWTMNNTGNTLNFNDANYIFADGFTTGGDTVRFYNADISLDGKDYTGSNITLNDSSLQLSNHHSAGDEYKFGNLISENDSAEITLDVNLAYDTNIQDSAPVADTIEYADGSSGLLNITELFITDDNGALGQAGEEGKIIQVLKGNGSLQLKPSDGLEILSWATNVYEYGVDSAETEHTADSIKIAVDRPSSTDTLRDLNRYNLNNNGEDVNHNRGFSFITGVDGEGNPIANEYHIYRDLDTTAAGTFTILGRVENGVKSVLSGKLEDLTISEDSGRYNEQSRIIGGGLGTIVRETYYQYKDADGNVEVDNISADNVSKENGNITFEVGAMGNDSGEDARGSMFELVNATELSISDVSVEDALRTGTETSGIHDGAAIYAYNEDATVELENTDFKNNSVKGGNGGAIANIQSETFSITNALFKGNSASANGGAIANINSESFSINNALFENNSAGKNGGAIYNADDMTIGAAPSEIVSNTETMISAGNTSFAGNTAVQGGAIYNAQNAEMTISSASSVKEINGQPIIIASTIEFTGNAAEQGGAIYNAGILNMTTSGNGKIIVDAATEITTETGTEIASNDIYNVGTLNLNGDITINSAISDAKTASGTTNLNGGTLTLGENATITQKDFNIASGVAFSTNAYKLSIANLITNAGTLEFTGGTNKNNIVGGGALNITGTVTNSDSANVILKDLSIASGADLTTNAGNLDIANEISNAGNLTFTGGTNKNNIAGEGALDITGTVTNADDATVEQNNLSIALGAGLTTNADNLDIANEISNAGNLTFTGGTNNNNIAGGGALNITGTVTNSDSANVIQKDLTIASGAGLTTNAGNLTIAQAIQNAGTLTFTGGENANTIQGTGQTVIDDEVTNNALISQSISVNNGAELTSDVSNIGGTIANEGKINLSGNNGTINNNISGAGDAEFSGSITNNASISQNTITIASSGAFSTAADKLITTGNSITNNGILNFVSGSNSNQISGSGETTINGNVINNALISQNVTVTSGQLTSTAGDLDGTITNNADLLLSGTLDKTISGTGTTSINSELSFVDGANIEGTLNMNNGTLDLNDGEDAAGTTTDHNIGKLTGTGTIKIDANLSIDAEEADSDTLNIVGSAENASINIDSINVTADHVVPTGSTDDPYDSKFVQVIDGAGKDNVNLTLGGNDGKVSTLTSDYLYEFVKHETNNGAVKVNMNKTTADLADFIQGTDGTENIYTYSMTRDETTPPEIGTTARTDAENVPEGGLNLYLNGHTLSSGQASGDGITVADGYTLNVTGDNGTVTGFDTAFTNNGTLNVSDTQFENNQNALTNNAGGNLNVTGSTFADNDTAITNNAGGNLNLSNITFDGNGVDVSNSGTLNLAGNTVIEGGITGQGTTNITSGVTNAVNTIVQDKLNISSGATLDGAGNVTANVNNEGTMNYADGSVNANTITGNGILNAQGNLTNNGDVSQGTVNIASGSTFTNSGTLEVTNTLNNTDSTIANSGELTLAGQNMQNNGTINGSGTTNISGKLQNNGSVEQDVKIGKSGEVTSNADLIKNSILNNGIYTVTGGNIANAITGSGDINLTNNMSISGSIAGNNINLNNGILSFAQSADISGATLSANGGSINLQNGAVQNTNLGNLILNSDLNLALDGSFADMKLDTITANSFTNNGGHSINISNILLSTPTKDMAFSISPLGSGMNDTVSTALAGAIQYTGGEIVYSPIYKYSAKYDPETALLNFNRVGGGGYDSYNPGVFAGAVAAQLGGYLTQLNSYDEAFRNMDMYMLMTQEQRQAMKMRNKYAAASADSNIVFDPTITQYENKAGWFRPYATFEKVDLKGGPTVSNVAYGSFFGAESEMYDLGHGWDGIWGVYGGYNGSHQSYDGVGIYQNGGTLGAIGMAYKGNFFTGLTANVGANSGEASTMFGQDNFTLLMSGVASKSGYNWELAKGKFIIQPNFLISYSYVNTFNYRDAQGVGIESDPLHAIQIEPGIKLIGNLKNGWQPYASVSMVWNIMDKTQFQANYVSLPELSVKPFVKYGVGVRKSWGERFTGFFQTYFTNGGRNGVGLQLGLRFMLGKSPKKTLNGPVPELKKTVIKVGRK